MWASLFLLLFLPLSLCSSPSFCSYTAGDGGFFEFTGLTSCSGYADTKNEWSLSLCCPFAPSKDANVACRGDECFGNSLDYVFGESKQGVELSYSGKEGAVKYTFICDKTQTNPVFEYVSESPKGHYNFEVSSIHACVGYATPRPTTATPVYVYLVPHSHDDVGWLKTIEGYYETEVKNILDTVVESLAANPNRTFIYVEQAYFHRWWTDTNTTDAQRTTFQNIYKNGQFEFVIGGWVMQDEACTTYSADIDQMTLGHQFLINTFGARPTKGWQIDPFGASSVTPTLNKLAGFDAHLIDRVTNKPYYQRNKLLQFNWQGSPSLGESAQIFTEIMNGGTDAYCDWFIPFDFNRFPIDRLDVRLFADIFKYLVDERTATSLTNHILAQWGCDFQFQDATKLFDGMDILVEYLQSVQETTQIYVKYTTLSEYYTALMSTPNVTWPSNHGGDFFPLFEQLYWTGYFTSRSVLKGIVRQGEAVALAAEQIYSMGRILTTANSPNAYDLLGTLRVANADAQHHDGVTGTSEPPVVEMYANDLINGIANAMQATAPYISELVSEGTQTLAANFSAILNIQPGQIIPLVFYNALSWPREEYVIIPVNAKGFSVVDQKQQQVPYQVNPTYFVNALGQFNLFFEVSVPALGYNTYFVSLNSSTADTSKEVPLVEDTTIQNEYISINISGTTGLLSAFTNKKSNIALGFNQNILTYEDIYLRSGAYAFNPKGPAAPITNTPPKSVMVVGDLVTEVFQVLPSPNNAPSYAKQVIRVYQASGNANVENFVEMDFEIGVLPERIEVITRFETEIQNGDIFFSDDNGFEYQQRTVNNNTIAGNHLPLIYASGIADSKAQFTVIADRTHSCASLENGEFEVMLHRNPHSTEGFGPALTDLDITHPVLRLVVDTPANSALIARIQPMFLNFPLLPFVGSPVSSVNQNWNFSSSFVQGQVPYNVHILSLYALNDNSTQTIVRLTHLFAAGEDPNYSAPVTVNLQQLFGSQVTILSIVETTLTANKVIQTPSSMSITLTPKQIRTFIVQFK